MPPVETDLSDKDWLAGITAQLRKALRKSGKCVCGDGPLKNTNTGGWYVRLGTTQNKPTKVEVWFDHYFGVTQPRIFWVGFRWLSRASFLHAFGPWNTRIRKERQVTSRDASFQRGIYTLKLPRRTRRVYVERYPPEYYFGMFWRNPKPGISTKPIVAEAIAFIEKAVLADGRVDLSLVEPKALRDITALETRQDAAERSLFRRHPELADRCKARDEHICQVCWFDFARRYPEIVPGSIGSYAEAHHKVPLHKRKDNKPTGLSDLVTVCANCHRMLHRLPGTRSDVAKLRAMVKKALK